MAVVRRGRRIQRSGPIGVECALCFGDLSRLKTQMLRDHLDGRGQTRTLLRSSRSAWATRRAQSLDRTRHMHGPTSVTEVTADLAEDGRLGEGEERAASRGLVSVNCLDKPDAGGLIEILDRLASSSKAAGEVASVREECDDYHLPRAGGGRRPSACSNNVPRSRADGCRADLLACCCSVIPISLVSCRKGFARPTPTAP